MQKADQSPNFKASFSAAMLLHFKALYCIASVYSIIAAFPLILARYFIQLLEQLSALSSGQSEEVELGGRIDLTNKV